MDSFALRIQRSRHARESAHALLRQNSDRGFSLIELMTVMAIFVLLSAVVLASNARFGSVIILQNLAHDIGLSVREAQIYGIAVRRFDPTSGPGVFEYGYGMHFAALGASYELFADANKNGMWDAGETVKATTLTGGYTLSSLCAPETTCGHSRIDILFKRPEPDACISINGVPSLNGSFECISTLQRTRVYIQAPRGELTSIIIDSSGQISVVQ